MTTHRSREPERHRRQRHRVTEAALTRGDTLQLGDVRFYFWPAALPKVEPPRGAGRTAPTRSDHLVFSAKVTTPVGHELDLLQRVDGGVLRIAEHAIELAAMELPLSRRGEEVQAGFRDGGRCGR